MRVFVIFLIIAMAVPCYGRSKKTQARIYKQDPAVAAARAAQIRQETADNHEDSVQMRNIRRQNQLQQQVYNQQELSRRQQLYSRELRVQKQRTRRQRETALVGW